MKRFALLLAFVALTAFGVASLSGCGTVRSAVEAVIPAPPPDPVVIAKSEEMIRNATADKVAHPENAAKDDALIEFARDMAAEAKKSAELEGRINALAELVKNSGVPYGGAIGTGLGLLGFVLTTGKSIRRMLKGQPSPAALAGAVAKVDAISPGAAPVVA